MHNWRGLWRKPMRKLFKDYRTARGVRRQLFRQASDQGWSGTAGKRM